MRFAFGRIMFKRIIDKSLEITDLILEYGWIVVISLVIIYLIYPQIFKNFIVLGIITIPIIFVLLTIFIGIAIYVGQFIFKKYADEYEKLVNEGVEKEKAFAKTSIKAIIVFIILLIIALLIILKNIFYEPSVV